jgi:hypothetical protein
MEQLTEILAAATTAISPEYFRLPVHGADPVYRERVYCYELYHQLRLRWPEATRWRLNGEVDKTAHPYFRDESAPKPDLLIHEPGTGNNYTVVEVKHTGAKRRGVCKDLRTLSRFRSEFGYRRAIYLLFGEDVQNAMALIQECADGMGVRDQIEIWLHGAAGEAAVFVTGD